MRLSFAHAAAVTLLICTSASADILPQSYICQSEPVTVSGQTIVVKANLENGPLNSFRSLEYSYESTEGTIIGSSKKGLKCITTGSNIDPRAKRGEVTQCDPAENDKLIQKIGIHFVFGLGFTTVDDNKFNFIKCEYKKSASSAPAAPATVTGSIEDSTGAQR